MNICIFKQKSFNSDIHFKRVKILSDILGLNLSDLGLNEKKETRTDGSFTQVL